VYATVTAPDGAVIAPTMAFVVFSLFNIVIALSARNETATAFNRDIIRDRSQLMLYGLALLFIILPVELGFPRFLGLAQLTGEQWLICIGFAVALLLVDEVIKVFMRSRRSKTQPAPVATAQS
jgi:Ca2+-transporting ATPase